MKINSLVSEQNNYNLHVVQSGLKKSEVYILTCEMDLIIQPKRVNKFSIGPDFLLEFKGKKKKSINYNWVETNDCNMDNRWYLTDEGLELYNFEHQDKNLCERFRNLIRDYCAEDFLTESMPSDCLTWLIDNGYVNAENEYPEDVSLDVRIDDDDMDCIYIRNFPSWDPFEKTYNTQINSLVECLDLLDLNNPNKGDCDDE